MGINGLWTLLAPISKSESLCNLAIEKGFVGNVAGIRGYRVGMLGNGWIYAACYHHSNTKSPKLAMLFAHCCHLLRLPIYPVFIFDGQEQPNKKQGKQVQGNHHWITMMMKAAMKEMLDHLGFPWVDAPGEAEAELVALSKLYLVDAIITEDLDAVVFGATTILQLGDKFSKTESMRMYQADDVAGLGLNEDALVLVGLLAGEDYSVCPF
ncbi:PIN domain-like protein [Tricholoma matsutake]|nr:PIN domain-like protein [Tricholoma matsutake 945]